jgi:ATP/ADP translocase
MCFFSRFVLFFVLFVCFTYPTHGAIDTQQLGAAHLAQRKPKPTCRKRLVVLDSFEC